LIESRIKIQSKSKMTTTVFLLKKIEISSWGFFDFDHD
jgi:hypothetical protein